MILQTKWGDQATSLSSNLFESAISTKKLIIFHKPCQPGCILHFLPGNPKTCKLNVYLMFASVLRFFQ